ncbi:MAG: glycosyltransferase family 2 protein, partial [Lachnospira sp.]
DDANAYSRRKFKFAMNEAYVRFTGYRRLKLPVTSYIYALRPIIVGLLPKFIYMKLHHNSKS